jgi:hypothetical protein
MAVPKKIRVEAAAPSVRGALFLPRGWLKDLGISSGVWTLAFGAKRKLVQVHELEVEEGSNGPRALISPDVQQELHLPAIRLPLQKIGQTLRFGYVLGILANVKTEGDRVVGLQQQTFRNLLEAAEVTGLFGYVFSPLDLDWKDLSAIGYRLDGKRWVTARVPMPDVLYDQIISRTFENRADVAPERQRLYKLLAARCFNPGYFDKWQVHQWLAEHESTKSYVPDALLYQSVEQAASFLYRYPEVYLKPVHGSLGIGIIRVQRRSDGRVYYQMKKKAGGLRQGQAGTITTFLKRYHVRLKKGPYLLQRALWLRTYQGRPFDIRLLLQKDGNGRWQRTKSFCRIAQQGQITSNLSTGGDALAVKQLLKEVLHDDTKVNKVMRELNQIAGAVPAVIEKKVGRTLGELGLDLGLDEFGRIWVIEVNAKPWKKPNTQEGEWKDLALLAFQRPIQYAYYLCKQHLEG